MLINDHSHTYPQLLQQYVQHAVHKTWNSCSSLVYMFLPSYGFESEMVAVTRHSVLFCNNRSLLFWKSKFIPGELSVSVQQGQLLEPANDSGLKSKFETISGQPSNVLIATEVIEFSICFLQKLYKAKYFRKVICSWTPPVGMGA